MNIIDIIPVTKASDLFCHFYTKSEHISNVNRRG